MITFFTGVLEKKNSSRSCEAISSTSLRILFFVWRRSFKSFSRISLVEQNWGNISLNRNLHFRSSTNCISNSYVAALRWSNLCTLYETEKLQLEWFQIYRIVVHWKRLHVQFCSIIQAILWSLGGRSEETPLPPLFCSALRIECALK